MKFNVFKKLMHLTKTQQEYEMKLSPNMEDYLEAVSLCANDKGIARVSDIRDMLGVKTPSVTGAMKALAAGGYVRHQPYSGIELTIKGRRAAEDVKKRHAILSRFLVQVIGVSPKIADMDACKMEHAISPETLPKQHDYLHKQTGDR